MTAKEFLRKAREVDRYVDEAMERVERLRAKLEAGRISQLTGMPRGGSSDWTVTADRLIELEQKVNARTWTPGTVESWTYCLPTLPAAPTV